MQCLNKPGNRDRLQSDGPYSEPIAFADLRDESQRVLGRRGAQTESDVSGQISVLEKAVASNPTAIVIAPTQFAALGNPIDEAAKKVKIIGLESSADTKAMTSLLKTDNANAGRIAADALAAAITKSYADTEGEVAIITSMSASR